MPTRRLYCPSCRHKEVSIKGASFRCRACHWTVLVETESIAQLLNVQPERTDTYVKLHISVSQSAWEILCQSAREYGYIRDTGTRKISTFFASLLQITNWHDTRPLHLQNTDAWHPGTHTMRTRLVTLRPSHIDAYAALAARFRINPYRLQAPILDGIRRLVSPHAPTYSTSAYVGPVLEAVGQRWLTGTPFRANADQFTKRRIPAAPDTLRY